jgi:molecular chaperone DnaK (HSP70)
MTQLKEWGRAAVDIEHKKHTRKIQDEFADTVLLTRFKLLMQSRRDQKTGELIIRSPSLLGFTGSERPATNESNVSSSSRPLLNNSNISSVTSAQESPINCVPIIADYLRQVNGYIRQEMKKQFPMMSDPSKFRYIMTVPAKWGDNEKRDMRRAAVDAGIINAEDHENRLSIITESHAATLYCEWELKEQFEFKKGQRYLVCDAGGGTVDLEIHEVLGEEEAISHDAQEGGMLTRCKLATKGNERSGSTFLDQRMEDFVRNQFKGPISDSEMYQIINDFINRVKVIIQF